MKIRYKNMITTEEEVLTRLGIDISTTYQGDVVTSTLTYLGYCNLLCLWSSSRIMIDGV